MPSTDPGPGGPAARTAIVKAMDVLSAFEGGRSSFGLTELARHADLPLTTAHRIVSDLVTAGILRREPDGQLRVGRRIWKIAQNAGREIRETTRPHLAELFRQTGRSAQLAIRDGEHSLLIDAVHGPGHAGSSSRPGTRIPLHACATGKVMLAFEEPWIRVGYLTGTLEAATPATEVDTTTLSNQLAAVRRDGFALSVEEARVGTSALAVPVLLGSGYAVAALGLVAPAADARRLREHLPTLRDAAAVLAVDAVRWPHRPRGRGGVRDGIDPGSEVASASRKAPDMSRDGPDHTPTMTLTSGCPVVHQGYEPFAQKDPFPAYARLRENEPVFQDERTGFWVVSRYADVRAVFGDWETFSSENAQRPVTPRAPAAQAVLDEGGFTAYSGLSARVPPDHTRIRKAAGAAFTPRRYKALESTISEHVRDLVDGMLSDPAREVDFVEAFANHLPVLSILSLLGVDTEHRVEEFKQWSLSRSLMTWGHLTEDEQIPHARHLVDYWNACQDLVTQAHATLPDSLVGDLVRAQRETPENSLTDHEIASVCYSLLFAGHETTTTLLANTVRMLLTHRDQWDRLVADPALAPGAIEESLRMSPSIVAWRRLATRDAEIAGTAVPAGSEILLLMGSANRDPEQFADPETFDIGRENAREHLAFGYGIHYCLGNKLAKLQSAIALRELAARVPDLRLAAAPTEIEFPDSISMRAPVAVPVTW